MFQPRQSTASASKHYPPPMARPSSGPIVAEDTTMLAEHWKRQMENVIQMPSTAAPSSSSALRLAMGLGLAHSNKTQAEPKDPRQNHQASRPGYPGAQQMTHTYHGPQYSSQISAQGFQQGPNPSAQNLPPVSLMDAQPVGHLTASAQPNALSGTLQSVTHTPPTSQVQMSSLAASLRPPVQPLTYSPPRSSQPPRTTSDIVPLMSLSVRPARQRLMSGSTPVTPSVNLPVSTPVTTPTAPQLDVNMLRSILDTVNNKTGVSQEAAPVAEPQGKQKFAETKQVTAEDKQLLSDMKFSHDRPSMSRNDLKALARRESSENRMSLTDRPRERQRSRSPTEKRSDRHRDKRSPSDRRRSRSPSDRRSRSARRRNRRDRRRSPDRSSHYSRYTDDRDKTRRECSPPASGRCPQSTITRPNPSQQAHASAPLDGRSSPPPLFSGVSTGKIDWNKRKGLLGDHPGDFIDLTDSKKANEPSRIDCVEITSSVQNGEALYIITTIDVPLPYPRGQVRKVQGYYFYKDPRVNKRPTDAQDEQFYEHRMTVTNAPIIPLDPEDIHEHRSYVDGEYIKPQTTQEQVEKFQQQWDQEANKQTKRNNDTMWVEGMDLTDCTNFWSGLGTSENAAQKETGKENAKQSEKEERVKETFDLTDATNFWSGFRQGRNETSTSKEPERENAERSKTEAKVDETFDRQTAQDQDHKPEATTDDKQPDPSPEHSATTEPLDVPQVPTEPLQMLPVQTEPAEMPEKVQEMDEELKRLEELQALLQAALAKAEQTGSKESVVEEPGQSVLDVSHNDLMIDLDKAASEELHEENQAPVSVNMETVETVISAVPTCDYTHTETSAIADNIVESTPGSPGTPTQDEPPTEKTFTSIQDLPMQEPSTPTLDERPIDEPTDPTLKKPIKFVLLDKPGSSTTSTPGEPVIDKELPDRSKLSMKKKKKDRRDSDRSDTSSKNSGRTVERTQEQAETSPKHSTDTDSSLESIVAATLKQCRSEMEEKLTSENVPQQMDQIEDLEQASSDQSGLLYLSVPNNDAAADTLHDVSVSDGDTKETTEKLSLEAILATKSQTFDIWSSEKATDSESEFLSIWTQSSKEDVHNTSREELCLSMSEEEDFKSVVERTDSPIVEQSRSPIVVQADSPVITQNSERGAGVIPKPQPEVAQLLDQLAVMKQTNQEAYNRLNSNMTEMVNEKEREIVSEGRFGVSKDMFSPEEGPNREVMKTEQATQDMHVQVQGLQNRRDALTRCVALNEQNTELDAVDIVAQFKNE